MELRSRNNMFADDQLISQESELELQCSIYKLNKLCEECIVNISTSVTKIMTFRGRGSVRSKIVINNQTLKQYSSYLFAQSYAK